MSATGLLSRLGFGQGLRGLTATNIKRSVPLLVSRGLRESLSARSSHRIGYSASIACQAWQPRRFYSSENFLKSKGDMKIAVIGQSMFGQEV